MTQSSLLRPREKIQQRSVQSLSEHELIQAIIGNGSGSYSVRKLARCVLRRARKSSRALSYEELRQIVGLGTAQAARLAAVFEYTRRYCHERTEDIETLLKIPTENTASCVIVCMNGSQQVIGREHLLLSAPLSKQILSSVCRRLIVDRVSSVSIGVRTLDDMAGAEICRTVYRALSVIGIDILDIRLMTEAGVRRVYEPSLEG